MLIYTGLGIALAFFVIFSFLNKAVFGTEKEVSDFDGLPNFQNGSFQNKSATPMMTKDGTYWKVILGMFTRPQSVNPTDTIADVKTDLKNLPLSENALVWFGHSSYFIIVDGKCILVDPVFHEASPVGFFGKPYPMSYHYTAEDFPDIDILVITHDHYDHLDYKAVCKLKPKVRNVITGKGVSEHLKLWGYPDTQIRTLNWDESASIGNFEFTCLSARHFSGRKFKRGRTLWSSFALKTTSMSIYLGGDSGYDTHFKEIGDKYGPFDLAILECGQYSEYWNLIHMMPEQTLQASKDLKASALLPVHWGKFTLSVHPWTEPIERLIAANADGNQKVFTPEIGAVLKFTQENTTKEWWRK